MWVSTGKAEWPKAWDITTLADLWPTPGSASRAWKDSGTRPPCSAARVLESAEMFFAFVGASPQVRISDGEKALVHIGDQVPIPVTTFNTGSTIGGNIVPITSFQYQDIGIRLDIEPRIHHNKEVTLVLKVEVSNVSGVVQGIGGQEQPIIGTRRIESTIRLMDG